jgi:hypothetical protein
MRRLAIVMMLGLAACSQTIPVYMKNLSTGKIAQCGPYKNNDLNATAAAMHEKQCIEDYKEQGFVRVPSPD